VRIRFLEPFFSSLGTFTLAVPRRWPGSVPITGATVANDYNFRVIDSVEDDCYAEREFTGDCLNAPDRRIFLPIAAGPAICIVSSYVHAQFTERFRRTILIIGLAAIACGFAVPRADVLGTTFYEADTPINQINGLVCRVELVAPVRFSENAPKLLWSELQRALYSRGVTDDIIQGPSHSLLNLICTLVC
jgi:hypothetical protein